MATKRQHYVPRFYLRYFTGGDGRLRAYRKDADRFFEAAPENVCEESWLYEARTDDPKVGDGPFYQTNHIEGMLSGFESQVAPLYERLISCCEGRDFSGMGFAHGRLGACALAANMLIRHPAMLDDARSRAPELAREYFGGGRHPLEVPDKFGLMANQAAGMEIAIMQRSLFSTDDESPVIQVFDRLAEKPMSIAEAPAGAWFVSCSLPMFFEGINDDATDFEAAYMPLSSGFAAIFCDEPGAPTFSRASVGDVAAFNERLLSWSDVWDVAYGRARGCVEAAVRDWKAASGGLPSFGD